MTSFTALKPSVVLAKAADLIEPEGAWFDGNQMHGNAQCMIEAIASVAPPEMNWSRLTGFVRQITGENHITNWNDAHTQTEVVAALRKASALAAEEGQ